MNWERLFQGKNVQRIEGPTISDDIRFEDVIRGAVYLIENFKYRVRQCVKGMIGDFYVNWL